MSASFSSFSLFTSFETNPETGLLGLEQGEEESAVVRLGRGVATAQSYWAHRASTATSTAPGSPSLLAAGDVLLTNRETLLRDLEIAGDTHSDLAVALQAYSRWGESSFSRLRGDFAFAIWNEQSETLIAVRDPLGVRRIFYSQDRSGLAVASSSLELSARRSGSPTIDKMALLGWMIDPPNYHGGSLFENVREVGGGEAVFLSLHGGLRRIQFWDPYAPRPVLLLTASDACEQLVALLRNAVERRCGHSRRVASHCSGGLDSATISFFQAKQTQRRNSGPPIFVTYGWDRISGCDETQIAALLADQMGADLIRAPAEEHFPYQGAYGPGPTADSPFDVHNALETWVGLELKARGVDLVLTGLGGDQLFNGVGPEARFLGQVSRGTPIQALVELWPQVVQRPRLFWTAVRRLVGAVIPGGMRAYLRPQIPPPPAPMIQAAALEEFERERSRSVLSFGMSDRSEVAMRFTREWNYLHWRVTAAYDAVTQATGVEAVHPFMDADLVEFVLRLDPGHHRSGATRKHLVREAMRPFLPLAFVERPKTQNFLGWYREGWRRQRPTMEALLRDSRLEKLGLISSAKALESIDAFFGADGGEKHTPTFVYATLAEAWLRRIEDA